MFYRRLIFSLVFLICLSCFESNSTCRGASDTQQDLQRAVFRLNSWLGADSNARAWRKYLNLNVLDAQAALGYSADVLELRDISERFRSGADGLEHPVFRQASLAIDAHLKSLATRDLDVLSQVQSSRNSFESTDLSDLQRQRAAAVANIKLLKKYYKQTITSRPRALLYFDLRPDDAISFLEEMQFELPPTRGRAQIQLEIKQTEDQIKAIQEQIDLLNKQRNQVEQWLDKLEKEREGLDEQAPPQPDDEPDEDSQNDGPVLEEQSDETNTTDKTPTETAPPAPRQDQLDEIDSARSQLVSSKQELEDKIKSLQSEIEGLRDSERQRQLRFRDTVGKYDQHLARFNQFLLKQGDSYFATAHQSLIDLKTRYQYAANPNTPRTFQRQLDELAKAFQELMATNDRRAAARVGNLLGWFENAGQNPGFSAAIKSKFSKPNLHVAIANSLVNSFVAQDVQRTERVNESIVGRLARGTADVNANVTVQTQYSPYQLHAALDFSGTIGANTYTPAGKLTAYAGSHSDFSFRRDIFANIGGLLIGDVYGDLQLTTWFKGISSRLRLVQDLALKQYCKTKALSESISRERTIEKLKPEFEKETDAQLEPLYDQFGNLLRPQTEYGRWFPAIYLHSTGSQIVVSGQKSTASDLAATNSPQQAYAVGSDVEVRLHESMLSNYASPLVAGKRLTNTEIKERIEALLNDGENEEEESGDDLGLDEPEEEFSITFADARPIQFEFKDGKFGIAISGKRFSREDQRINDPMRITVMLKIINKDGKLQLVPAEQPSVELIGGQKNIRNVSFMSFLEDQLELVLEAAFENEVVLPDNLIPVAELPEQFQDVASQFKLNQFRMEQGWFYGGWTQLRPGSGYVNDLAAIWPAPLPGQEQLDTDDQLAPAAAGE